jgi:adenylate kinase family enzyme
MPEAFKTRTVIIGNSGSGKSTLAEKLAALAQVPAIDLDLLRWDGDGYGMKRDKAVVRQMALEVAARPGWVMEGVYGWLAEVALPRATALVWLDVPWSLCRGSLLQRGMRRGGTEAEFATLMAWAEAYWERQTSSSFAGHARLFADFPRAKLRLRNREEVHRFLADPSNLRVIRGLVPGIHLTTRSGARDWLDAGDTGLRRCRQPRHDKK